MAGDPRDPAPQPGAQHLGEVPGPSQEGLPHSSTQKTQAIKYMFFEKEVSSKFCTLEKSAMAWSSKRAILGQDIIRRLLNTSGDARASTIDQILLNMCKRLKRSGYNAEQTREILLSGVRGYRSKWGRGEVRHRRSFETEGAIEFFSSG